MPYWKKQFDDHSSPTLGSGEPPEGAQALTADEYHHAVREAELRYLNTPPAAGRTEAEREAADAAGEAA